MTAKKPVPQDWTAIIEKIGLTVVLIMSTWAALQSKQNNVQVAHVKETVAQIQTQTDGTLTAAKLAVAISAESLAESTKKPEHQKIAEEARAAYEAQLANQRNADKNH